MAITVILVLLIAFLLIGVPVGFSLGISALFSIIIF